MKKNNYQLISTIGLIWKSKLLLFMRATLFLVLLCITQVFAISSYSQSTRLSLDMKNRSIKNILGQIEDQSQFYFIYDATVVDVERRVSIESKNELISEVLDEIFKGSGVVYKINDRQIALTTVYSTSEIQQTKSVSSKVTDSSRAPLPGVTVVEKGTTNGTVTNVDGEYLLNNISDDAVLQFSFVGMRAQEITVSGKTTIDVKMEEDAIGIEEVVAVGYGVQKKVNMTGSVSSINFDEEVGNRPITNASQALSGQTTGVWVSQNSGSPGNDEAQIRIRGWGTMNNSEPLVIIDGVEGDFAQINPNDIENISILKDAASSAIYGSKAANGVILITTKTGQNNEKMQVDISSYAGVQSLGRRYDLITNSAEFMEMCNQALENGGSSALFSDDLISSFRNGTDKYKYPNTDWFDVLFSNATIQEHNVSIRGGTGQSSSFLSFNYLNQDGMVPNTSSERYGIRANQDLKVNNWLEISGKLNYIRKTSKNPYSISKVWEMLIGASPFIAPYTRDGNFGSVEAINESGVQLYTNRNPLIDAANGETRTEANFVVANVSLNINLTKDLLWKTNFASNGSWSLTDKYNETIYGYTDSGEETTNKNYNSSGIEMSRSQGTTINNNLYSTLSYNKEFGQNHNLSAIAGIQMEGLTIKSVYARSTDPVKEGLTQVSAGTDGITATGTKYGYRMFSYFGRVNYSFMDKYLFEANLRADGSSRFKEGNRWGVFPGFSAGWRLIDEDFIQNINLFSNLKLRASWGQLGNQNVDDYWPYLTTIEQSNTVSYNYDGSFSAGAAVTSMTDENITWETTSTLDFGIDAGFLNNKISLELDYFRKKTSDILVQLPVPSLLGDIDAPYENVGEMINNGIEIVTNFSNQKRGREQLGYDIGLNFTYIKNEVTTFQGGDSPDQTYLVREGYSYQSLYGYKAIGVYQTDEEAAEHMYSSGTTLSAGNIKYEDVNNDGDIDYQDKQGLGNTIPKITFGITPRFSFKGFDLSLLFQGIAGVHAYTQSNFTNLIYQNLVISKRWRNAWSETNTNTNYPSLKFDNTWDQYVSSFWVKEISFIKLKNIQLGYTFPRSITSRLRMQKLYVYANAQNVFTIVNKDYEGYDPERSTFDTGYSMYPTPRIVTLGINLNF